MPEQIRVGSGHVTVNEHVPTEKFNRYVDEKVQMWMKEHRGQETNASEYEVAFFDEDTLGEVSCLIVIHSEGQLWRAWETGDSPRSALARSLEHLRIDDEATSNETLASQPTVH